MIRYFTRLLCLSLVLFCSTAFAQVDSCAQQWVATRSEWGPRKNISIPVFMVTDYHVRPVTGVDGTVRMDTAWGAIPTGKWSRVARRKREIFMAPRNPNCPADTTYHRYELQP